MRIFIAYPIVALLFQDCASLNHDAYLGGTDEDDDSTTTGYISGPFFDPSFFAPVPTPQYTVPPKPSPTVPPTSYPAPVKTPKPTVYAVAPAPTPAKPDHRPTIDAVTNKPSMYPESKPTTPPTAHTVYPTHAPVKIATRTATYVAQWGAEVTGCQYLSPNVFFSCQEGGVLTLLAATNALCRSLSDDYMQCRQSDLGLSDAYVEFTCSGVKKVHLMADANIGPSKAWACYGDGNIVTYLTMSRNCYTDDGQVHLVNLPECTEGEPWTQSGINFCAIAALCTGQDTCDELKLGSVSLVNTIDKMQCSQLDEDQDLQSYDFKSSSLSSLNLVDWRFSGLGRGCHWQSSSLMLRCEAGGELDFLEDYPFCTNIPEENAAVCDSFAPYSTENEEVLGLLVSCTGRNEDQLVLSVEIPSEMLDVDCTPNGIAIQSVMISRACGEQNTDEFRFVNDPAFCDRADQVFQVDDERSHCFVGDTCEILQGCDTLQLPPVTADTSTSLVGHCIYAV